MKGGVRMNFVEDTALNAELVPVLLGISPEAMQTARRFFKKYGTISHVFCDEIPLSARLSLCVKYHPIRHSAGNLLMLTALKDFAKQLGNADLILYLIPCTEDYSNFLWRNRESLEPYFVIAGQPEMERVWYGENSAKEDN